MTKTIFIILINFIIGTVLLKYGVSLMSSGLEKANTDRMKKCLQTFAGKTSTAFITGTLVTALVQSSTAIIVITVGLVNSGLMKLPQAVGIILGANLGTTLTAQLMSFKITNSAYFFVAIGLLLKFFAKRNSVKCLGTAVAGLGLMFTGLGILSFGAPYIKESQAAHYIFMKYGNNPLIGLLIGLITTMLVQSSSATVGLTIVLFNAGLISFDAALGLTFGDNIGTSITTQIASLGTNLSAKRTAWAHTLYNIVGVLLAMLFFSPFSKSVQLITHIAGQGDNRLIANAHTIFNLVSACLFLPLTSYYVKFIEWVVNETD
ncbi:Na/Pi cotransporter family protein [Acetivibrio cellulolyticus]|uniref:Na/Pi cotransporter family protein n=1 Tax=Acetivibrio cellulolyticus TaxID=35830 RepID=UPI0001E2D442|nr:Na/Pi symporter [Acetivibrio cellulolyticus]